MVNNLCAMHEAQVRFLGQEDPLEKRMATNSSILACRIPWTDEPGGLHSMGHKESDMTELVTFLFLLHSYSCLISFFLSLLAARHLSCHLCEF